MSHAKFPPSAAERWLKCGYTIKMAPYYPEIKNKHSEEGTRKHAIAAAHLLDGTNSTDSGMQFYLDKVRGYRGELHVEREIVIVPDLCWGTADAGIFGDYSLTVPDLKWGTSPVSAVSNPQLKLYALGFLREWPLPRYSRVTLAIIQPNAKSGPKFKPWETTVQHILEFRDPVMRAIDEGLKENPKAVAGSHCFWCPAKIHCKAYLLYTGKKS